VAVFRAAGPSPLEPRVLPAVQPAWPCHLAACCRSRALPRRAALPDPPRPGQPRASLPVPPRSLCAGPLSRRHLYCWRGEAAARRFRRRRPQGAGPAALPIGRRCSTSGALGACASFSGRPFALAGGELGRCRGRWAPSAAIRPPGGCAEGRAVPRGRSEPCAGAAGCEEGWARAGSGADRVPA